MNASTEKRHHLLFVSAERSQSALAEDESTTVAAALAQCGGELLGSHFVYFLSCERMPDDSQRVLLEKLLEARLDSGFPGATATAGTELILVAPRAGMVSPWASQTQDIFATCGLGVLKPRIERCEAWLLDGRAHRADPDRLRDIAAGLYDRMVQTVFFRWPEHNEILLAKGEEQGAVEIFERERIEELESLLGVQLTLAERERLLTQCIFRKTLTASELMMFAQVNSEHCRHKIFGAEWRRGGQPLSYSLFQMIKHTTKCSPEGIVSAYHDNAAVFARGQEVEELLITGDTAQYRTVREELPLLIKVETHNHPTAISPYAGAGTGIGGEIRDEAAVGRGSTFKMGLCGFTVSHLRLPEAPAPWEIHDPGLPAHIASAQQIMLEGPVGGAAFANEFGRPTLCGFFRSFEARRREQWFGYHKPIMIAGGLGTVRQMNIDAGNSQGDQLLLVVLGGPALPIGLGGGSASSRSAGSGDIELDFSSVQRQNPEMQRRCQEVIDCCTAEGNDNPIVLIHDVGAGGLANALPELIHDLRQGAEIDMAKIPIAQPLMTQLQIWCNEAQERFVLALKPASLDFFQTLCEREDCPFAVVGKTEEGGILSVIDSDWQQRPGQAAEQVVQVSLPDMLGGFPAEQRVLGELPPPSKTAALKLDDLLELPVVPTEEEEGTSALGRALQRAVYQLFRFPAVAAKHFLITIGDRTVGGLVHRDQMVGPWQVPVADVAVSCADYSGVAGEAMAVGERSPLALEYPQAAARMAVGEALTNIAGAGVSKLGDVRLSANWMADAADDEQSTALYESVKAVGMELCPQLGIAIPVGKDSLSMNMCWQHEGNQREVRSPVSLVVSAFAAVNDVRRGVTPQLRDEEGAQLLLLDLGLGRNRLGGSALAQICNKVGGEVPDLDQPAVFQRAYEALQQCLVEGWLLALHDRSDGGLLTSLAEMAFAGRLGLDIQLPEEMEPLGALFAEELGFVMQVPEQSLERVKSCFAAAGLGDWLHPLGSHRGDEQILFSHRGECVINSERELWQRDWQALNLAMRHERDNPLAAEAEFAAVPAAGEAGLRAAVDGFEQSFPALNSTRPRVAVLRGRGVNGHYEMAAAFRAAGFEAVDVQMNDLVSGRQELESFQGIAAAGGFSFGDVLGAGRGWAASIINHPLLSEAFADFFSRTDRFTLGICNGCQMLSELRELIPGSAAWPYFKRNASDQYEGRLVMVRVESSASLLLQGMEGWLIPVPVAHGEGRAVYTAPEAAAPSTAAEQLVVARYADSEGAPTEVYPHNPNGSPDGIAGVCSEDGRVTLMMPHPERAFRNLQLSWCPPECGAVEGFSPWLQLFRNAAALYRD